MLDIFLLAGIFLGREAKSWYFALLLPVSADPVHHSLQRLC